MNKLKIGLLLPLSGEYQEIGKSIIYSTSMALREIDDETLEFVIKDIGSDSKESLKNTLDSLDEDSIQTSIILVEQKYHYLLEDYPDKVFISLSNRSSKITKNVINFGVNLNSQFKSIFEYLNNQKKIKTLILYPEGENEQFFENYIKTYNSLVFKKFKYSQDQSKLTKQIEKLTSFNQRKINLNSRIKQLQSAPDSIASQNEIKKLESLDTLGNLDFDSVIILDFGNDLKAVLSTLAYVDAGSDRVTIVTINQWFDESLFLENTSQNIFFPSIDLKEFKKFNKNFTDNFNQKPYEISILAYDAVAYIYYTWINNKKINSVTDFQFQNKVRGRSGDFYIINKELLQNLIMYRVSDSSFSKL